MPSSLLVIGLFVGSYSPLLLIFAIRNQCGGWFFPAACLLMAGLTAALPWAALRATGELSTFNITAKTSTPRTHEVMSYVATYLVPFISPPGCTAADLLSVGVFLALIGAIYLRGGLVHMNPMLALVGFQMYEVETYDGLKITVMSKAPHIRAGSQITLVSLTNYVHLEVDRGSA